MIYTDVRIEVTDSGYNDSELCLRWLREVFDPKTASLQKGEWRILLLDGYESHLSLSVLEYAAEKKILLVCLPAHTSHLLQPLDVGLFGPLQQAYGREVGRLAQLGLNHINKCLFLEILSDARLQAYTPRNVRGAWRGKRH